MLENHHVLPFMEAFRQGFQMRLQMDTLLSHSKGLGFRVQGLGNGRTIGKNAHSNILVAILVGILMDILFTSFYHLVRQQGESQNLGSCEPPILKFVRRAMQNHGAWLLILEILHDLSILQAQNFQRTMKTSGHGYSLDPYRTPIYYIVVSILFSMIPT